MSLKCVVYEMMMEPGLFKVNYQNDIGSILGDLAILELLELVLHDIRTDDKLHVVGQLQPVSQPDQEILGLPQPKAIHPIHKRLRE